MFHGSDSFSSLDFCGPSSLSSGSDSSNRRRLKANWVSWEEKKKRKKKEEGVWVRAFKRGNPDQVEQGGAGKQNKADFRSLDTHRERRHFIHSTLPKTDVSH